MKSTYRLVLLMVAFFNARFCFSQSSDTIVIPIVHVFPGDTVVVPVYLRNHSFAVGGVATKVVLIDSLELAIVDVGCGESVREFGFYSASCSRGTVSLVMILNMPGRPPARPLYPNQTHELAQIRVALRELAPQGYYTIGFFDRFGSPLSSIADSTGYLVTNPQAVDGGLICGYNAIEDRNHAPVPDSLVLIERIYPNPANAGLSIEFSVARDEYVRLGIYDVQGRLVTDLISGQLAAGNHTVYWNGTSNQGTPVATGIYFCRVSCGEFSATKRISLIK